MKKVTFNGQRPSTTTTVPSPDDWVENRELNPVEPMKRLTIDVPLALHKRIKAECARCNLKMAEAIRDLLEQRFEDLRTVRNADVWEGPS